MAYFAPEQWVALSVLAGVGILTILNVLATRFRHERDVHDLRLKANALRNDYAVRMAALKAANTEEPVEAEVVGEIGPDGEPINIAA